MRLTQYSPLRDRLLGQMIPVTESGCWIWTGTCNEFGYGLVSDHYKKRGAHRASYELFVGPIPSGKHVCHKCDVRCCVNPAHLFLGTSQDNNDDMRRKGRARYPGNGGLSGEAHPGAKLTAQDVLLIRSSSETTSVLAKRYGVTYQNIKNIRTRVSWKCL